MTVGENIKSLRLKANLTQKDLADALNVSYQTVSKWENNTNEPDLATLKAMSKIFSCSIDSLVDPESKVVVEVVNQEVKKEEAVTSSSPAVTHPLTKAGYCDCCHHEFYPGEGFIKAVKKGDKHGVVVNVCKDCMSKKDNGYIVPKPKKEKLLDDSDKVITILTFIAAGLIWAAILGVCIGKRAILGLTATIVVPIVSLYCLIALVFMVLDDDSNIGDMFFAISGFSVRWPGIIFTWDLEGIGFLIGMKLLFGVLSFLLSIATFIFAVVFCGVIAGIAFPFKLIFRR